MNWSGFRVFLIVILGFLFSIGVMLIDYGATFKDSGGFGQSLAFGYIDARLIYHEGIVLIVFTFLCMVAIAVDMVAIAVDRIKNEVV